VELPTRLARVKVLQCGVNCISAAPAPASVQPAASALVDAGNNSTDGVTDVGCIAPGNPWIISCGGDDQGIALVELWPSVLCEKRETSEEGSWNQAQQNPANGLRLFYFTAMCGSSINGMFHFLPLHLIQVFLSYVTRLRCIAGIFTDGSYVFAAGWNQRLVVWNILRPSSTTCLDTAAAREQYIRTPVLLSSNNYCSEEKLETAPTLWLRMAAACTLEVADVSSLDVTQVRSTNSVIDYRVAVIGQGMQVLSVSMNR
jgi:hypothetical protein